MFPSPRRVGASDYGDPNIDLIGSLVGGNTVPRMLNNPLTNPIKRRVSSLIGAFEYPANSMKHSVYELPRVTFDTRKSTAREHGSAWAAGPNLKPLTLTCLNPVLLRGSSECPENPNLALALLPGLQRF